MDFNFLNLSEQEVSDVEALAQLSEADVKDILMARDGKVLVGRKNRLLQCVAEVYILDYKFHKDLISCSDSFDRSIKNNTPHDLYLSKSCLKKKSTNSKMLANHRPYIRGHDLRCPSEIRTTSVIRSRALLLLTKRIMVWYIVS